MLNVGFGLPCSCGCAMVLGGFGVCGFGLWIGMFHCISIVLCVWLVYWCLLIVGIVFCFSLCFVVCFWFVIYVCCFVCMWLFGLRFIVNGVA